MGKIEILFILVGSIYIIATLTAIIVGMCGNNNDNIKRKNITYSK